MNNFHVAMQYAYMLFGRNQTDWNSFERFLTPYQYSRLPLMSLILENSRMLTKSLHYEWEDILVSTKVIDTADEAFCFSSQTRAHVISQAGSHSYYIHIIFILYSVEAL